MTYMVADLDVVNTGTCSYESYLQVDKLQEGLSGSESMTEICSLPQ
jgi:hypothetical protein